MYNKHLFSLKFVTICVFIVRSAHDWESVDRFFLPLSHSFPFLNSHLPYVCDLLNQSIYSWKFIIVLCADGFNFNIHGNILHSHDCVCTSHSVFYGRIECHSDMCICWTLDKQIQLIENYLFILLLDGMMVSFAYDHTIIITITMIIIMVVITARSRHQ